MNEPEIVQMITELGVHFPNPFSSEEDELFVTLFTGCDLDEGTSTSVTANLVGAGEAAWTRFTAKELTAAGLPEDLHVRFWVEAKLSNRFRRVSSETVDELRQWITQRLAAPYP